MTELERTGYQLVVEGGDAFDAAIRAAVAQVQGLEAAVARIARSYVDMGASLDVAIVAESKLTEAQAKAQLAQQTLTDLRNLGIVTDDNLSQAETLVAQSVNQVTAAAARQLQEYTNLEAAQTAKYNADRVATATAEGVVKSAQESAAAFQLQFAAEQALATAIEKQIVLEEQLATATLAEAAATQKAEQAAIAKASSTVTGAGSATLGNSLGFDSSAISNATKLAESLGLATASSIALGVAMGGLGVAIGVVKGLFDILGNVIQGIVSIIETVANVIKSVLSAAFDYVTSVLQNYINTIQTVATITAVAVAIIGGVSVDLAAKYQDAMNVVRVFSANSASSVAELDANMKALDKTILQIGSTTVVSMGAAAKASLDLVQAGIDVKQQTEGVLKAVIDLSIASTGELKAADAATVVAVALHAYGLQASQATDITNALTAAVQYTPASFSNMANALKYVAPEAALVGMTVAETTAAIGLMANAGVTGSIAGTNLRQMLVSLEKPSTTAREVLNHFGISLYDAAGATRPFVDVLGDLQREFSNTAVAAGKITEAERNWALETAFTVRGAHAAIILINQGTDAYNEMTAAISRTNTELIALALQQPLAERFTIAKNAVEAMATELGTGFLPILGAASNAVIQFIGSWDISSLQLIGSTIQSLLTNSGWSDLKTNIENAFAGDVAANINKVVDLLQTIATVIQTMILPALGGLKDAILEPFKDIGQVDTFAGAIDNARITIINLAIEVTKIISFVTTLIKTFNDAGDSGSTLRAIIVGLIAIALSPMIVAIGAAIAAMITLVGIAYVVGEAIFGDTQVVRDAASGWDNFLKHLETVFPATAALIRSFGTLAGAIADFAVNATKNAVSFANAVITAFISVLEGIRNLTNGFGAAGQLAQQIMPDSDTAKMLSFFNDINHAASVAQSGLYDLKNLGSSVGNDVTNIGDQIKASADEISSIHINILESENTGLQALPKWLQDAAIGAQSFAADLAKLNRSLQDNNDYTPTAAGNNEDFKKALDNAAGSAGKLKTEIDSLIDATRTMGKEAEDALNKFNEGLAAAFKKFSDSNFTDTEKFIKATNDAIAKAQDDITKLYTKDTAAEANKKRIQDQKDADETIYNNAKTASDHLLKIEEDRIKDAANMRKADNVEKLAEFKKVGDEAIRVATDANSAADRAASRNNQSAASALGDRQRIEEQALSNRLKAQDQAAVYAEKLAQAKTPEDKAKITQDYNNQKLADDRSANNQKQQDELRTRHEQELAALKVTQDAADFERKKIQERELAKVRYQAEEDLKKYGRVLNEQEKKIEQTDAIELALTKESQAGKLSTVKKLNTEKERTLQEQIDAEIVKAKEKQINDTLNNVTLPAIKTAFDAEIKKNADVYKDDVEKLNQSLKDKLQSIQDNWTNKVAAEIEKGGAALQGPIDTYTKILVDHLNAIRDAAKDTTTAINAELAAAYAASLVGSGKPGSDGEAFNSGDIASGAVRSAIGNVDFNSKQGFYGPNSPSAPGGYNNPVVGGIHTGPVPMAASVASVNSSNTSYNQPVQINNSYNVNASYSSTQSSASVKLDMQSMVALSQQ